MAGWRGGQIACVAAGMVVGVGVLRATPTVSGVLAAFGCVLTSIFMACWPISGRTVEEWTPVATRWLLQVALGNTQRISHMPESGWVRAGYWINAPRRGGSPQPEALAHCSIIAIAIPSSAVPMGAVKDSRLQTYTAVLAVEGQALTLLSEEERRRRTAAWSDVLAGLARQGSSLHRIQWVERTVPDGSEEIIDQMERRKAPGAPAQAIESYRDLAARASQGARTHEVLVALSVRAARRRGSTSSGRRYRDRIDQRSSLANAATGVRGATTNALSAPGTRASRAAAAEDLACSILVREAGLLERSLRSAGLSVIGALGPRAISGAIARGIIAEQACASSIALGGASTSERFHESAADATGRSLGKTLRGDVGNGNGAGVHNDAGGDVGNGRFCVHPSSVQHSPRSPHEWTHFDAKYAGVTRSTGAARSQDGLSTRPPGRTTTQATWPWSIATQASWSWLRTDSTYHATYWIAEWPRIPVTSDFLRPLLLQSSLRASIAVTMEPISPSAAVREVEQAKTAEFADSELRRRGGFMMSARRRREQQVLARRETELADGHAQYRFSGYVTVTAGSLEELEEACHEMEQTAGQSLLEIRRMFGEQEIAFTYTLPLARGLL